MLRPVAGGHSPCFWPGVLRMTEPLDNVLCLCTGNVARSLMAEASMQHLGSGSFTALDRMTMQATCKDVG